VKELGALCAVKAELHVLGGEEIAVVKFHALSQLELICGRPARCKRFLKKIGT